jgi:hypothetical protein
VPIEYDDVAGQNEDLALMVIIDPTTGKKKLWDGEVNVGDVSIESRTIDEGARVQKSGKIKVIGFLLHYIVPIGKKLNISKVGIKGSASEVELRVNSRIRFILKNSKGDGDEMSFNDSMPLTFHEKTILQFYRSLGSGLVYGYLIGWLEDEPV